MVLQRWPGAFGGGLRQDPTGRREDPLAWKRGTMEPERRRDPEIESQACDLAKRPSGALDVWADAMATLEIGARVH